MTSVIAKTDNTTVYFTPGTSDFLLLSFRAMNVDPLAPYWGQKHIEALGINCLGFVPHTPSWYPLPEMEQVVGMIEPWLSKFDRRLGYGFSMGGYAALAHGDLFGLTDVLAFGPQWSIEPAKVSSFDRRYRKRYRPVNAGMEITKLPKAKTFLVYDPLCGEDQEHIRRIDPMRQCRHIEVRGGGHVTVAFVGGAERMRTMFDIILIDDAASLGRLIRKWKKAHPRYAEDLRERWSAHRSKRQERVAVAQAAVPDVTDGTDVDYRVLRRAIISLGRKGLRLLYDRLRPKKKLVAAATIVQPALDGTESHGRLH